MNRFTTICLVFVVGTAGANADITKYTDKLQWDNAISAYTVSTINWDDVGSLAEGTYQTILGNRYSSMLGSPTLSVDTRSGLYVGNPNNPSGGSDPSGGFYGADFFPVSPSNVFSPDVAGSPEGTLTITFGTPVYALGAWFLDVEGDFAGTGIKVANTLYAFTSNQGTDSQSFLGIFSTSPFTTAEIHMATGAASNGVGIDDTMFAVVPIPDGVLLCFLGLAVVGLKLRKSV
jgi:hypothetical protein